MYNTHTVKSLLLIIAVTVVCFGLACVDSVDNPATQAPAIKSPIGVESSPTLTSTDQSPLRAESSPTLAPKDQSPLGAESPPTPGSVDLAHLKVVELGAEILPTGFFW